MSGWAIFGIVMASIVGAGILFYFSVGIFSYFLSIYRKALLGKIIFKKFSSCPEKYGIDHSWWDNQKYEKLRIYNSGLKLTGFLIRAKQETKKVAIVLHGYFSNHKDLQPQTKIFYDNGYNVLTPDLRAHGESDGNTIGMAYLDKTDVMLWIEKMIEIFGKDCQIALFGLSMGAATVGMVSGENLPNNVKCIVSDCGYENAYSEFSTCLKRYHVPEFPFMPIANQFAKILGKYNLKDANVIGQVSKSKLPILFIHGTADNFVPCYMGKNLYHASNKKNCELYLVEGASHAMSFKTNPKAYTKKIIDFTDKYIK